MPITVDSFEHFYQGTCAENYVSTLFYFAGYETSKLNPDAGIDFIVTNIARVKFKGEAEVAAQVQVKSTLLSDTGAAFFLTEDELNFLSSGERRFTAFVMLGNFKSAPDPDTFNLYADMVDRMIDADMDRYREVVMKQFGWENRAAGRPTIFEFSSSEFRVFWLNSAQLRRAKDELILRETSNGLYRLGLQVNDGALWFDVDPKDTSVMHIDTHLVPELNELRYIMRPCQSNYHFLQGKFMLEHL